MTDAQNPWRKRLCVIYDDTVHVAPDTPETRVRIRDAAHDLGMMSFLIDGSGLSTMEDVDEALVQEVMPPFPIWGWDAQYSILTNLEWFDNDVGYVLTVGGCDQWLAHWPEGFTTFVEVTIASTRLWQAFGGAFHVVFLGGDAVADHVTATAAREARERVREFGATVTRHSD